MIAAGGALIKELHALQHAAIAQVEPNPRAELRARVKVFLKFMHVNPHFHRLMVDEFMDSSSPLVQQTYQSWTSTTIAEMRELLLNGKATGDFTEKDGAFVFMMIIGASEFFTSALPMRRIAFGNQADDDKSASEILIQYENFLVDIIIRGLKPVFLTIP